MCHTRARASPPPHGRAGPRPGHAEGIGGSIRTRHSALLEVTDYNRCRKTFAVQSHERITRKKTPCCSAVNHWEEDGFRERLSPGRRRTWTSSRGSLPKNLIAEHPMQGSLADEGFRRHLLSRYSVRAEERDGEDRGLRRCGFSRERLRKTRAELTEDTDIWLRLGES